MHKHRCLHQTLAAVLEAARAPCGMWEIIRKARLSYQSWKFYREYALNSDLMYQDGKFYVTTLLGLKYRETLLAIDEILEIHSTQIPVAP